MTKREMARDIIQELYRMDFLPSKTDGRVQLKMKSPKLHLEVEYQIMLDAFLMRTTGKV